MRFHFFIIPKRERIQERINSIVIDLAVLDAVRRALPIEKASEKSGVALADCQFLRWQPPYKQRPSLPGSQRFWPSPIAAPASAFAFERIRA
jgi:uncharacterized protein (DUF2126 family)